MCKKYYQYCITTSFAAFLLVQKALQQIESVNCFKANRFLYVTSNSKSMKLKLRRTLVRSYRYSKNS